MNIKFITLALAAATTTLFGGQSSPPQDQNKADIQDTIEANIKNAADIIVIGGGTAGCIR